MKRLTALIVAALTLAVAGCDDDDSDSVDSAPSGAQTEATQAEVKATEQQGGGTAAAKPKPAAPGLTIKTSDSEFGTILFDGSDQAIYLFDKESSPTSECYGACAEAWPPVLTKGKPQAGPGIQAGLLGTTKRDDGSTQITYKDHPLYYYVDDPPSQVLCHDVVEFGGLWLVVEPSGNPVT